MAKIFNTNELWEKIPNDFKGTRTDWLLHKRAKSLFLASNITSNTTIAGQESEKKVLEDYNRQV